MRSFTFCYKRGKLYTREGIIDHLNMKGVCGRCYLYEGKVRLDCYSDDCSPVPLRVFERILTQVIKILICKLSPNIFNVQSSDSELVVYLGRKVKRGFSFMKTYKINNTWGIRCYNRVYDNAMCIEVFMLQVPWDEVVENFTTFDKDEANGKFKELVDEYKKKEVF